MGQTNWSKATARSPWAIVWEQLTATMVVILIVAAVVSAALGDYKDAVAILAIVVLNAMLGFSPGVPRGAGDGRAEDSWPSPASKCAATATSLEISARDLVAGDVVLLEAGNSCPRMAGSSRASNLRIQEAALTGESAAGRAKTRGDLGPDDGPTVVVGDRRNMVFMGTAVTYGRGHAVVTDTGMHTELGAIAAMIQAVHREPTPLQRRLDQLGGRLAIAALAIVAADVRRWASLRGEDCQGHVPDGRQHGGGGRPRGVARRRHDRAGAGRAANAAATRPDPQAAGGRDAGLGDRHLLRQDRHAHREPHACRHPGRGGTSRRPRRWH